MTTDSASLPDWLTIQEVCEYLRIGPMSLYKLRKAGVITSYYIHGKQRAGKSQAVRFKKEEIVKFLENQAG